MTPTPFPPTWEKRSVPYTSPFTVGKDPSSCKGPLLVCRYIRGMRAHWLAVISAVPGSDSPPDLFPSSTTDQGAMYYFVCGPSNGRCRGWGHRRARAVGRSSLAPLACSPTLLAYGRERRRGPGRAGGEPPFWGCPGAQWDRASPVGFLHH